jgi:hypothetical protein
MKHRLLATTAVALAALVVPSAASAGARDRDRDGMPDKWEKRYGLNVKKNDAAKDRDRDGVRNIDEYRAGSNPRRADTDRDGVRDGDEQGGTVASFDQATGTLTINLFAGGTLTGKVDDSTKIECDHEDNDRSSSDSKRRHGADDGPGRSGDDNPGRSGDDNPGRGDGRGRGSCTVADLQPGAVVNEAEMNEGDDGPAGSFHEIELAR